MAIDVRGYARHLAGLYERQRAVAAADYLEAHAVTRGAILRQVEAAALYLPYVRGRVLDWGCRHAPDACLIRRHFGAAVELHGCDVFPPGAAGVSVFHTAAGLEYRQLRHPYRLPYGDDHFDTVVADGVLEHVPNDYESLKELYRVLRPDGALIICCLPNKYSYLEAAARRLGLPSHLRRYGLASTRERLLHSGFEPLRWGYLQMVPTLSGVGSDAPRWLRWAASALWGCNAALERCWPLNRLASNLFLVAAKRTVMGGVTYARGGAGARAA